MFVSLFEQHPPARGARDKAQLHEVRLVNVLYGVGVLPDGRGERIQPAGAAVELGYHGAQKVPVRFVEAEEIYFHAFERLLRVLYHDAAVPLDERKIAHAF